VRYVSDSTKLVTDPVACDRRFRRQLPPPAGQRSRDPEGGIRSFQKACSPHFRRYCDSARLVGRAAAAQIESRSGGERIFLRCSPTGQACGLLNPQHAAAWHFPEDVLALLFRECHRQRRPSPSQARRFVRCAPARRCCRIPSSSPWRSGTRSPYRSCSRDCPRERTNKWSSRNVTFSDLGQPTAANQEPCPSFYRLEWVTVVADSDLKKRAYSCPGRWLPS